MAVREVRPSSGLTETERAHPVFRWIPREVLLAFLCIGSLIGGVVIFIGLWQNDDLGYYWFWTVVSIVMMAAGVTYFWLKSKFYRL